MAALAATVASPLAAKPVLRLGPPQTALSKYVEARTAAALGDAAKSATLLAAIANSSGDSTLARQATSTAIRAGEFPLALSLARGMPRDKLALDARLLLVADALNRGKTKEALQFVNEQTGESDGGFLAPLLRAWSIAEGGGDGAGALATSGAKTTLHAPSIDEQRTYLLFRQRSTP